MVVAKSINPSPEHAIIQTKVKVEVMLKSVSYNLILKWVLAMCALTFVFSNLYLNYKTKNHVII